MSTTNSPTHGPILSLEEGMLRIKQSGSKLTSQRVAMLELFSRAPIHLTAQQVFDTLTATEPAVSRATVYNNLELFEALHIVTRHQSNDGTLYFDSNTSSHHHMSCTSCGRVQDVDVPDRLIESLRASSSLTPSEGTGRAELHVARIWFDGLCEACS